MERGPTIPGDRYRAIVIGATGAVGSSIVRALLRSPNCEHVAIVVRRRTELFASTEASGRLSQHVVAMDSMENDVAAAASGYRVAFSALGVGQARKVSPVEFWKVEVEYPTAFGRACRAAGVSQLSALSALGARRDARVATFRAKAALEDQLGQVGFPRTRFFRPSLLLTPEIRYGAEERLGRALVVLFGWALPKRFHAVHVEDLGTAMCREAELPNPVPGVRVLFYPDFAPWFRGAGDRPAR